MRELLYTVLELEEWCSTKLPCSFCVSLREEDKITCQIITRSKVTHKLVAMDFACQNCKEKFENNQIPKCERCGRLRVDSDTNYTTGKYVCRCIERGENIEEKELPALPQEERQSTFYERQINGLREELATTEEELQIEREEVANFHEKSKE
jgi:late competence protein required for DNA uptake (superfamily II DNA/RNA helicase)